MNHSQVGLLEVDGFPPISSLTTENRFRRAIDATEQRYLNLKLFHIFSKLTDEDEINQKLTKALAKGAQIDAKNEEGKSPLHIAVAQGYEKVVKFLLNEGASARVHDNDGKTPIQLAENKPKIQEVFNDFFMDVDEVMQKPGPSRKRPLDDAVYDYIDAAGKKRRVLLPADLFPASGVKHSLHGVLYQLKLLMLFTNRAAKNNYEFRIATELIPAEKFDDLVFQYVDKSSGRVVTRFLQAKHKQDSTKVITLEHLITTDTGGEFSLPKYFDSYRKILKSNYFQNNEFQDFVICTNIDIKDDIGSGIDKIVVTSPDELLDTGNNGKRYKLKVDKNHQLYKLLFDSTDVSRLAKLLAKNAEVEISLKTDIFKLYHLALAKEVIDVQKMKFTHAFINNVGLNSKATSFRELFIKNLMKERPRLLTPKDAEQEMAKMNLKLSSGFGKGFTPDLNPDLNDIDNLAVDFADLVLKSSTSKVVKIDRKKFSKRTPIGSNIDKLAGFVIIKEEKSLKFSKMFLDVQKTLPQDVESFRTELQKEMGLNNMDIAQLKDFNFDINSYYTCEEDQMFSKKELPADYVTDKEIEEFFDKLTLAVNQPNEEKLGEILIEEMGTNDKIRLLDAELVTDNFEKEMMNWFKRKEGKYLTNLDMNAMLQQMEIKVNTLITAGLSLAYPEEIQELGVKFTDGNKALGDFMKGSKQVYNLEANEKLLGSSLINQALKMAQRDSFIFVQQRTLLRPESRRLISQTFEANVNLLIIESNANEDNVQNLFETIGKILKEKPNKKLILIGDKDSKLPTLFKNDPQLKSSLIDRKIHLEFSDLTQQSRERILDKKVTFQGKVITAKEVLHKANLDISTLVDLIKSRSVIIGSTIPSISEVIDHYITQTLTRNIEIDRHVLSDTSNSDVFALSGTNNVDLEPLVPQGEKIVLFSDLEHVTKPIRFIILDSSKAKEQFEKLAAKFPNKNVHWLIYEDDRLSWQHTRGSAANILSDRQKIIHGSGPKSFVDETSLVSGEYEKGAVIISGVPGAGKTTMMDNLSKEIKDRYPDHWVLKLNLNDLTQALRKELDYRNLKKKPSFMINDKESVVKFISDELLQTKDHPYFSTPFEKKLLEHLLSEGRLALLLDGFDEISPNYSQIVIDVLKCVKSLNLKLTLVTTRPHMIRDLENSLQVSAYKIEPLPVEKQKDLLAGYWEKYVTLKGEKNFEVLADHLLHLIRVASEDGRLTETPFVIKMISEVYSDNIREINSKTLTELKEIDLYSLYKKFIDRKFDVYFDEKLGLDSTKLSTLELKEKEKVALTNKLKKVALVSLFEENELNQLFSIGHETFSFIQDIKAGKERIGLIDGVVDEKVHFFYRSLAQYFFSDFLRERIQSFDVKIAKFLFQRALLNPQHSVLRSFLSSRLDEKLPKEVINGYTQEFQKLWDHNPVTLRTADRSNVLHVAAEEGNFGIINFMVDILKEKPSIFSSMLTAENLDGSVPLHLAAKSGNINSINKLLTYATSIEIKDSKGYTPLRYAVNEGHTDVAEKLMTMGANVNSRDVDGMTVFEAAAKIGNFNLIEILHKSSGVAMERSPRLLHIAAEHGHLDIVKYLVENDVVNISVKDEHGKIALDYAVSEGHATIAEFLKRSSVKFCLGGLQLRRKRAIDKCSISWKDIDEISREPTRNFEDIKIDSQRFIRTINQVKGAKKDQLYRLLAELININNWQEVIYGYDSQEVKNVVRRYQQYKHWRVKKANLFQKDINSYSLVHAAAEFGDNEILSKLKSSDHELVKGKDIRGNTALHYAARSGEIDIAKILVKFGSSPKAVNANGNTILHHAAKSQNLDLVKWLIAKGADKKALNKRKQSPAHMAAKYGNLDTLKYLTEGIPSGDVTYTFLAEDVAESGDVAKMEYLESKGVKLDKLELIEATFRSGKADAINWLVNKNINLRTGSEKIALAAIGTSREDVVKLAIPKKIRLAPAVEAKILEKAVQTGNLAIVKHLMSIQIYLKQRFNLGRNALFATLEAGQLKLFKWFLKNGLNDLKLVDELGENLAHAAAKSQNLEALKFIQEEGVNIFAKTKKAVSVLHLAAESGNVENVQWLIRNGLEPTAVDKDGNTLRTYAEKSGSHEMEMAVKFDTAPMFDPNFSGKGCLGGKRRKRDAQSCLISWEDVDEIGKTKTRDMSKIVIDDLKLERFLGKTQDMAKRVQLIQLIDEVTDGKYKGSSEKVKRFITRGRVMKSLQIMEKYSNALSIGLMGKDLVGDLINGDFKGLAVHGTLISLGIGSSMASTRLGAKGTMLMEGGRLMSGGALKTVSSFMGRATSAFIIFDLVSQVKELNAGNKDVIVRVAGDSTILLIDTAAIGIEIAEAFGVISGVSSVAGPIGLAVGTAIFLGVDIYYAVKAVRDIEKLIPLTGWERFKTGFRAFVMAQSESYIQELVNDKLANNQMVENGIEFLKNHTSFVKYIFPTGKVDGKKIELDKDNEFDFTSKRHNIKWHRAKPDKNVNYVCFPKGDWFTIPSEGAYLCSNLIGIENSKNRRGDSVFINLGEGRDDGRGFLDNPNIFLISDGTKNLFGGNKDDIFNLEGKNINGGLHGRGGRNTLDIEQFDPSSIIDVNPSFRLTSQTGFLDLTDIKNFVGRKKIRDIVKVDCGVNFIDAKGGENDNHPDLISVTNSHMNCTHDLLLKGYVNTDFTNNVDGDIIYKIEHGAGVVKINTEYKMIGESKKFGKIILDSAITDLLNIEKKDSTDFIFITPKGQLRIKIFGETKNIVLVLQDGTIFKFDNNMVFALQESKWSPRDIKNRYTPIAQRANLFFIVKTQSATITMNFFKSSISDNKNKSPDARILPTNPTNRNYIICGSGPNIFLIDHPKNFKDIPDIYIYVNDDDNTNTLYLQKLIKKILENHKGEPTYKVTQDREEVTLQLVQKKSTIITVHLIGAPNGRWVEHFEIIGKHAPLRLKRASQGITILPVPLEFDKAIDTIILAKEDVEDNTEVIIKRKSAGYQFFRLNDDLVITNRFALNSDPGNEFSVLLFHYYKEYNELHTLKFIFFDGAIDLKRVTKAIEYADDFKDNFDSISKAFLGATVHNMRSKRETLTFARSGAGRLSTPISGFVNFVARKSREALKTVSTLADGVRNIISRLDTIREFPYSTESFSDLVTEDFTSLNLNPASREFATSRNIVHFVSGPPGLSPLQLGALGNKTHEYNMNYIDEVKIPSNESLFLVDFIIRKMTKQKYIPLDNANVDHLDIQGCVLNIVDDFEELIKDLSKNETLFENLLIDEPENITNEETEDVYFDSLLLQKELIKDLTRNDLRKMEHRMMEVVELFSNKTKKQQVRNNIKSMILKYVGCNVHNTQHLPSSTTANGLGSQFPTVKIRENCLDLGLIK